MDHVQPPVLTPRPYQEAAVRAALEHQLAEPHPGKASKTVCATGTGKSLIGRLIVERHLSLGHRVVWVAHDNELLRGAKRTCGQGEFLGARLGATYDAQLTFAMKDTLRQPKRLAQYLEHGAPDVLLIDESHGAVADTYLKLREDLGATYEYGLTATPDRGDSRSLAEHYEITYSYPMVDAQRDGWILPLYCAKSKLPKLDLGSLASSRRDYLSAEMERELIAQGVVDHTVAALDAEHAFKRLPLHDDEVSLCPRDITGGIITYCVTIRHAELTAAALKENGWDVEVLHSQLPQQEQDSIVERMRQGKLRHIVNVMKLGQGVDIPYAQMVVLARATQVWSLYIQAIGRAVRQHATQERAYVLDLTGCSDLHSIVSAPVLVHGHDCTAPDGRHRYLDLPGGGGRCHHCGDTVRCALHVGPHRYGGNGKCDCGALPCPRGPSGQHDFLLGEGATQSCVWCGLTLHDPIGALAGRALAHGIDVEWHRLMLPHDVYAAHLGEHGILFNAKVDERWWPSWYVPVTGTLHWLTNEGLTGPMSRLVTNDVARRAEKIRGQYGGAPNKWDRRVKQRQARQLAEELRVWAPSS